MHDYRTSWLRVDLLCGAATQRVLSHAVRPYVTTVMQTGVADGWHFERLRQGKVLRIHFRGNHGFINELLCDNAREHFSNYFEHDPIFEAQTEAGVIDCKVEIDPAQSSLAVYLADRFHYALSDLLLGETEPNALPTVGDLHTIAIQLHLSTVHALQWSRRDAAAHFRTLLRATQRERGHFHNRTFRQALDREMREVHAFVNAYWDRLDNRSIGTVPEPFRDWSRLIEAMDRAYRNDPQLAQQPLLDFWQPLLRRISNCLGIFGKNEQYLLFQLTESLSKEHVPAPPKEPQRSLAQRIFQWVG